MDVLGLLELAMNNKKKPTCPLCHSLETVRIVYGYPSDATLKSWQNKEIALGGCIVRSNNPLYQCLKCGHKW